MIQVNINDMTITQGESIKAANNALLQAGQTCLNESVVLLIKFGACGQVGATIAPPDNKP